jgi:hypothetical protein
MQFSHGISSITNTFFEPPINVRTVWILDTNSSGAIFPNITTQGMCPICFLWVAMFKNKKKLISTPCDKDEIVALLASPNEKYAEAPVILQYDNLHIRAARSSNGDICYPSEMRLSAKILDQIKKSENHITGSTWWKVDNLNT